MVLIQQIDALLDYLESNKELALGHFNKSKEGRNVSRRRWADCARLLNVVSPDCPTKTPEEWRMYYNEFKFKTLKKIKAAKAERSATGGGTARNIILTASQERLYNILGRDVGDPLPSVCHNPLEQGVSQEHGTIYKDLGNDIEYEVIVESLNASEPKPEQETESESALLEPLPPKRRRHMERQRARRPLTQDSAKVLQASQERLERIEERHSNAILEQARATSRLAAAIEKLAERFSEPLIIVHKNE